MKLNRAGFGAIANVIAVDPRARLESNDVKIAAVPAIDHVEKHSNHVMCSISASSSRQPF